MRMRTMPGFSVASILFFCLLSAGCSEKKALDSDLEQAGTVIKRILSPENLSNSMFAVAYPECKPSQFAGYMVSGFGASELPPLESNAGEEEIQSARILRMPLWPDSVSIAAEKPDPGQRKQLVLKFDDTKGVLIVEYFEDATSPAVGSSEFTVPKVTASAMAKLTYGSYIEMGGR